jgi:hypothetical protein
MYPISSSCQNIIVLLDVIRKAAVLSVQLYAPEAQVVVVVSLASWLLYMGHVNGFQTPLCIH